MTNGPHITTLFGGFGAMPMIIIVNERFAEALLHNKMRDFWAETKKSRRNKASVEELSYRLYWAKI